MLPTIPTLQTNNTMFVFDSVAENNLLMVCIIVELKEEAYRDFQ